MDTTKSALNSSAIWGVVIALLPLVARFTGIEAEVLEGLVGDLIQIIGLVLAAWGRIKAEKVIDRLI
jgi:hypothetical protein